MKIEHFYALCKREWDDGHGDVCGLALTEDSRRELAEDVVAAGNPESRVLKVASGEIDSASAETVGALITDLANPVTRSVVWISKGEGVDLYEVRKVVPAAEQVRL